MLLVLWKSARPEIDTDNDPVVGRLQYISNALDGLLIALFSLLLLARVTVAGALTNLTNFIRSTTSNTGLGLGLGV